MSLQSKIATMMEQARKDHDWHEALARISARRYDKLKLITRSLGLHLHDPSILGDVVKAYIKIPQHAETELLLTVKNLKDLLEKDLNIVDSFESVTEEYSRATFGTLVFALQANGKMTLVDSMLDSSD